METKIEQLSCLYDARSALDSLDSTDEKIGYVNVKIERLIISIGQELVECYKENVRVNKLGE